MKKPHEIEAIFSVEIDDPSRFELLKTIHDAARIKTPFGGSSCDVFCSDNGLIFADNDGDRTIFQIDTDEDFASLIHGLHSYRPEEVIAMLSHPHPQTDDELMTEMEAALQ